MIDELITYTEEERSVQFESYKLSKTKMDAICSNKTVDIMNQISEYVAENWFDFYNLEYCSFISSKSFITKIRNIFPKILSNTFDSETYKLIHTCFNNKSLAIKRKLILKDKVVRDILYYKKTTIKYETNEQGERIKTIKHPGDVREIRYKYIETDKTKVLSFLSRYGTDKSYEWIKSKVISDNISSQKKNIYKKYLETIEMYGFDELLKEAIEHRNKVFEEYITPCMFSSNTLHIDSRIYNMFTYNKKKKSCVHAYAEISIPYESNGIQHKTMIIPLKYNKAYHGKLEQYNSTKSNNHIYLTCCIDKSRRIVDFHISRKQSISHRAPTDNDIYTAFDVNTNGDKIVGSNDISIGHIKDDKIVSEISKLNKELKDGQKREKISCKKQNRIYKSSNAMSNRKRHKMKKLSDVMSQHNRQDVSNAISEAKEKGSNHMIFEDINGRFSKSKAKDTKNNQNFNDKTSSMQISSIKNYALEICRKKHISVTFIQPEYTSQRCPKCGCIHKENRKTQETFECVECGYKFNADKNATDNMIHRVVSKKLCEKLLKRTDDGYIPNEKISHDMILDMILQFNCNTLTDTSYLKRKENTMKLES